MTTDPDRDKKIAKLRAEIEDLAKEGFLLESMEVGFHSYSAHLPAHRFSSGLFGLGSSSCAKTDILVLSGRQVTDNAGIAKLSLNSLLCGVVSEGLTAGFETYVMIRRPNFVATPQSALPSFATVDTHSTILERTNLILVDRDRNVLRAAKVLDVTVDIRTWKHDGSPAPRTEFTWICTVEAAISMFIGG